MDICMLSLLFLGVGMVSPWLDAFYIKYFW